MNNFKVGDRVLMNREGYTPLESGIDPNNPEDFESLLCFCWWEELENEDSLTISRIEWGEAIKEYVITFEESPYEVMFAWIKLYEEDNLK